MAHHVRDGLFFERVGDRIRCFQRSSANETSPVEWEFFMELAEFESASVAVLQAPKPPSI